MKDVVNWIPKTVRTNLLNSSLVKVLFLIPVTCFKVCKNDYIASQGKSSYLKACLHCGESSPSSVLFSLLKHMIHKAVKTCSWDPARVRRRPNWVSKQS